MKVGVLSVSLVQPTTSKIIYPLSLLTWSVFAVLLNILFFVSKNCRTDRPISNETTTFIERDIFIAAEDAEQRSPYVWIEQRTFESGKETMKARQLFSLSECWMEMYTFSKDAGTKSLVSRNFPICISQPE
jgi:hypothetical protein